MLDDETIGYQREILATYRRTLAHLLRQTAQYGGESNLPAHIANNLHEVREHIRQIKTILRSNGAVVDDYPEEEPFGAALGPPKSYVALGQAPLREATSARVGLGGLTRFLALLSHSRGLLVILAVVAAIFLAPQFVPRADDDSTTGAKRVNPSSQVSPTEEGVRITSALDSNPVAAIQGEPTRSMGETIAATPPPSQMATADIASAPLPPSPTPPAAPPTASPSSAPPTASPSPVPPTPMAPTASPSPAPPTASPSPALPSPILPSPALPTSVLLPTVAPPELSLDGEWNGSTSQVTPVHFKVENQAIAVGAGFVFNTGPGSCPYSFEITDSIGPVPIKANTASLSTMPGDPGSGIDSITITWTFNSTTSVVGTLVSVRTSNASLSCIGSVDISWSAARQ